MRIVIVLFVLVTSMGDNVLAQDFKNKEVRDFLISIGEMKEDSKCSYFAYDLLKSDVLKPSDTCGIYKIGKDASDSFIHLLILDKQEKIFLKCPSDLYQTLSTVFSFFEKSSCRFTDSEKLAYIEGVMLVHYQNSIAIPW